MSEQPTPLNIVLSELLSEFVLAEATSRGLTDPAQYVEELIQQERKRKIREHVEELLIEGLNSGPPVEATPEFYEAIIRRAEAAHRAKPAE